MDLSQFKKKKKRCYVQFNFTVQQSPYSDLNKVQYQMRINLRVRKSTFVRCDKVGLKT